MCLFVILYVWQNVGMMKMKLEYRDTLRVEEELARKNDRLIYEIEKMRTMKSAERYAGSRGLKKISPESFDIIDVRE